ncbi:hypothetical protein CHELA1G2_12042 [Hyphomicrobiales bacterium]|nr:hypothetical protein CHELA1G2_12042 [Hyphomicrobiales bacterium]
MTRRLPATSRSWIQRLSRWRAKQACRSSSFPFSTPAPSAMCSKAAAARPSWRPEHRAGHKLLEQTAIGFGALWIFSIAGAIPKCRMLAGGVVIAAPGMPRRLIPTD